MAIIFHKQPQLITPSGNDIIFQFESDNVNILYFDTEVLDATTSAVITKMKIWVTPNNLNGGYTNLKTVLQSYTAAQVAKNSNLIVGTDAGTLKYRIKITEKLTGGTTSAVYNNTSEVFKVIEGELNRLTFSYFNYRDYLLNSSTPLHFLTYKPNNSITTAWFTEYLSFIADSASPAFKVQIKTYKGNTLFNTYTSTLTTGNTYTSFRINVSPKDLISSLNVIWDDVTFYTVQLITDVGAALSETRNFYCYDLGCSEPVNILWVNDLGGIDSFTFINPKENISISKKTMKLYDYKLDSNGIYSNENNNILNPDEKIISSVSTSKYNLTTFPVDDLHYSFLTGLLNSKQVWVELSDYTLLPVTITTNSIEVKRRKYSNELLRFPLSFTAESGLNVTSEEVEAFGIRIGQIGLSYNTVTYSADRFYTQLIGDATNTLFTVSHNLNSKAVTVDVIEESTGEIVAATVIIINVNQISVEFSTPPATNSIRLNIFRQD